MKKLYFLTGVLLTLLKATDCFSQDFSNKGKDFWLAYPAHIDGNNSRMALYISANVNTSGVVSFLGNNIPFTITANQATVVQIFPKNYNIINAQDEGKAVGKGIHITSLEPVVVYAHILNSARSGSTLILPTSTLGKEYIASSFADVYDNSPPDGTVNGSPAGSQFCVVAVEDNTTVEITTTADDAAGVHAAGSTFNISLNKGDVYQYRTTYYKDITGTLIKSKASASGACKPIAVFSGSSWTNMDCGNASGGDNLFQQLMPKTTWGKNYLTAPFADRSYDLFRIIVSDPTTIVTVNGSALPVASLVNNSYYQLSSSVPNEIIADKPVMVCQYMVSQTCDVRNPPNCANGNNQSCPWPADPEMIILNSIDQTLSDITVVSARRDLTPPNTNIIKHFFTIIIKTTVAGSLKIDGAAPAGTFVPIGATGYSYLQENVTASTLVNSSHHITADSGFIALAYGMGNYESYGYNAGTNVKDLYQQIGVSTQYGIEQTPSVCTGSPFKFKVSLPYSADSIYWVLSDLPGSPPNVMVKYNNSPNPNTPPDSIKIVNGKTINWYSLPDQYNLNQSGTYNVKITTYSANLDGCGSEQYIEFQLKVYSPPVADFSPVSGACLGSPVQFSDKTVTERPSYIWSWNFDDPGSGVNNTSTASNPIHTFTTPGIHNVTFYSITTPGCISTPVTIPFTIYPLPAASISNSVSEVCQNGTASITFTGTSGTAPYTFTYNINGGTSQTVTTVSGNSVTVPVATNTPGTFNYKLISVKDGSAAACSQTQTGTAVVTVNPLPTAGISSSVTEVCQNETANIIFTGAAGTAPYTFTYNINGGTSQTVTTVSGNSVTIPVTTSTPGKFTYNLINVQDGTATACSQALSASAVVNVNPLPTASISRSVAEVCQNINTAFVTFTGAGGTAPYTFTYTINGGTLQTITTTTGNSVTLNVVSNAPGTFTYNLVSVKDASATTCSQSQSGSTSVVVNPLPLADFTTSPIACATRNFIFTSTSVPNAGNLTKWSWNFDDGTSDVFNNGTPFNHPFSSAKTYNVTLQVETDKGCVSAVTTKPVVVNVLPKAGFISPEACLNDIQAPFTDTSKVKPGSIVSWQWNFGDANANLGNPNTSVSQNPTHHYTQTGSYTGTLVVTTDKGCTDTVKNIFFVNGSLPLANYTVQNPTTLCSNKPVSIIDGSTVDIGSLVKVDIYWDYTNDPTIKTVDDTPVAGKLYSHTYPEFSSPASKTVTIYYIAYSGVTCLSTYSKTITLLATPQLQFSNIPPVCEDAAAFQLTQAQLLNILPGSGAYSGNGVTAAGLFTPSNAGVGQQQITYTYTGTNSCVNSVSTIIEVNPKPFVDAGPDKTVLEGGSVALTPTTSSASQLIYNWTPSTGLNNASIASPLASPTNDITYKLTVTTDKNCSASDQVFVKVLKTPEVPNIFSPNGDGIHDTWQIKYLESYPGCTVDIVNRYGEMVYHSVGYSKPWDGKVNGKDVPVGTYYFVINPKNGRNKIVGYVDVIR